LRVVMWYTKIRGKEYTLRRVSHRTNLSTQNDVKALQKVFRNTFEKYTLLVYIEVRMQRETNTFSILFRVMVDFVDVFDELWEDVLRE